MSSDQLIISRLTSGIKKLNTIKIPKEIVSIAKNLIIDISGVTFAGSKTKSASLIYNLAEETYLEGNCEIIEGEDDADSGRLLALKLREEKII